jgi:hypothetical protein
MVTSIKTIADVVGLDMWLRMPQTAAQLEVSSTPPDADIEIDGSSVGHSTCRIGFHLFDDIGGAMVVSVGPGVNISSS